MPKSPLLDRMDAKAGRLGTGAYAASLAAVTLAAAGLLGLGSHLPWLFPSLGPTVMLFFESPHEESSSPRNALVGHGIGLLVGAACAYAFGLQDAPPAPVGGLSPQHVLAGVLSVAVTSFLLMVVKAPHPPAGATTLIVSLGILTTPVQLLTMAAAITLVTALGCALNLALGTRPAR
ncbi:HPP family protein [Paenarthrobacter sp. NPDC089675]|uniref:HPP family protein n=1 Tax=Paenarthrobacter sp. NPDC089675 TaxID=3364376 RepID=UPI00380D1893